MIRTAAHWDVVHFTPLWKHFTAAELLIGATCRLLRKPLFLDVRAGRFLRCYEEGSVFYRWAVRRHLGLAAAVGIEGERYRALVDRLVSKPVDYVPNYVGHARASPRTGNAKTRLLCLGRIVPHKGVDLAIETTRILRSRGVAAELVVIGSGPDFYLGKLMKAAEGLPVIFMGALPGTEIEAQLRKAHLFLFPTTYEGEGHSNALTEAMSTGLIPICSDHGSNREVVADAGIVLPVSANAEDYANAILALTPKSRKQLASAAVARIAAQFTAMAVMKKLVERYRSLMRADVTLS